MADFIDRQASESDLSDSDAGSAKSKSTGDTSEDEAPVVQKKKDKKQKRKAAPPSKKDKKKRRINSSDEEEEEDSDQEEAKRKEEMTGFLVDEPEEEEEEAALSEKSGKSDSEGGDLDDDDLDLIQENLDVKGVKKARQARIEDSDEEEEDRDKISKEIFGAGYDEDDEPQSSRRPPMREERSDDERSGSDSDGSGADNFIEYDKGERRGMKQRNRKRKEMNFAEGALDEARDIFGVEDFNFNDFYDENEPDAMEDEEMYEDEDGEERPKARRPRGDKMQARETLLDTMEPSELEKGYFSASDKGIQSEDRPERFQMRRVPITEATDEELALEAAWIYAHAFKEKTLTKQDDPMLTILQQNENISEEDGIKIENDAPERIKETLKFIRNSAFEVPFIGFYRKEGVADMLSINDLWKVYKWDQKWCHLLNRRNKLITLMRRMQAYLEETGEQHHKPITDADFYDVEAVQTPESLADVQTQFQLFYAPDIAKMMEWEAQKRLMGEAVEEDAEGLEREIVSTKYKQATRKDKYQMCVEYGLGELAARFGLTAKQFAENLDWRRHDVEQDPVDPYVAAEDYITTSFSTAADVLKGAIFMLAKQISREPLVRMRIREHYRRRACVTCRPTLKGRETMDDAHPMWRKRYILEKPISELEGDDYLQYHLLKEAGMMTVTIEVDKKVDKDIRNGLLENILQEQPFHRDEYTEVAESWNKLRTEVVTMAIGEMLFAELKAELDAKLLEEAKEFVVKRCSEAMYTRLISSSFKPPRKADGEDEDDEDDRDSQVRVLGMVYSTERDEVSFGALVDQDGNVVDTIRLPYLMNRRGPQEERQKADDMAKFTRFVHKHRPHVIAVAGENLQARFVKIDIEKVVMQLYADNKISSNIQVVIHDNDAAKVYMQSKQAVQEHPDYPPNLRQALSLARCLLDPLVEYSHLYNIDEDIFCLSLHPLQAEVNKEDLQEAVMLELINRVNEVGVDINKCVEFSHHSGLLQFVCGLGPRKASYLLKTIRQNSSCLESRTKLVTLCKIGPKVFMNCSGFIKIDTVHIQERTDAYVEILDGSRVHPETYEWARKMAVDALEVDDTTDPTAALEEILQQPDRLKDLDLDAFAEELQRQGFGNKGLTLYDIRSELFCRYKDLRQDYQEPTPTGLFAMLTKETCATLFTGKLITGRVERVVFRRVNNRDENEQAEPIRDENSDMWKCAYCHKKVPEVADLFVHYDEVDLNKGGCPGTPVGIRLRLDNGLTGFIHNKQLSDNPNFRSPAERVKLNQVLHARVLKVDPEKYSVDLTCKSSELRRDDWFDRDNFWDDEAEKEDKRNDDEASEKKKHAAANQFVKRVISHPNFHNVAYKDAERMLSKLEQGDAIIRPSSKSANNLTVTWKVADGIYCHVDVIEQEKLNQFTLGKKLIIGNGEEFEDLEEILSRYIQPMASYCREALNHRYALENVQSEKKDEIDVHLHQMKRDTPSKIPYCFTPSAAFPGKFTLNYLVGKVRQEYFTPQPDGVRFRKQLFTSLEQMLSWFKMHYREAPSQPYGNRYR